MKTILGSSPRVTGRTEFERASASIARLASRFSPARTSVGISLVGERKMAELNRNYKGRRGAAEVLTFSYGAAGRHGRDEDDVCGEIFLCWKKIARGAERRGVSGKNYMLRLVVHGLCHIKGYGHQDERSTRIMEQTERKYLRGILPDAVIAELFK